ncbi:MAG: dethiobiotin synthase [Candidatus Hydrogenedentes bacterium]|nr:dethiobiotin synthase [Candidatus Hydrogenedentota bacterium]
MSDRVFIAGTGTDVGKTVVTAGILRYLRQREVDAVVMKPVQTGADTAQQPWRAPDLEAHWRAAAFDPQDEPYSRFCPYLYAPACSPHLAARLAGDAIDPKVIHQNARALLETHEYLIVEGAGGIYVPLTDRYTNLDLMKEMACPIILVAHVALGTINYTLLSLESMNHAGLKVAGIILSTPEPLSESARFIAEDNPAAIEAFTEVPIFGIVPWLEDITHAEAPGWDAFEEAIDWELLLTQLGLWHD